MTEINEKLLKEVLSLPSHLRTILIDKLIESLNIQIQKEIDDLWAAHAEKRITGINSGKDKSISGEIVLEEILNRFKK